MPRLPEPQHLVVGKCVGADDSATTRHVANRIVDDRRDLAAEGDRSSGHDPAAPRASDGTCVVVVGTVAAARHFTHRTERPQGAIKPT